MNKFESFGGEPVGSESEESRERMEKLLALPFFQKGEGDFAPFQVDTESYWALKTENMTPEQISESVARRGNQLPTPERYVEALKINKEGSSKSELPESLMTELESMSPEDQEAYLRGFATFRVDARGLGGFRQVLDEKDASPTQKDYSRKYNLPPEAAQMLRGALERDLLDDSVMPLTTEAHLVLASDLKRAGLLDIFPQVNKGLIDQNSSRGKEKIKLWSDFEQRAAQK